MNAVGLGGSVGARGAVGFAGEVCDGEPLLQQPGEAREAVRYVVSGAIGRARRGQRCRGRQGSCSGGDGVTAAGRGGRGEGESRQQDDAGPAFGGPRRRQDVLEGVIGRLEEGRGARGLL